MCFWISDSGLSKNSVIFITKFGDTWIWIFFSINTERFLALYFLTRKVYDLHQLGFNSLSTNWLVSIIYYGTT